MSQPLLRNFRFMSMAVAGVAVLQFVLYFVVARYLGHHDYGSFAIALTMALLAAPLCGLGMNVSIVWSHARRPEQLAEVLGASLLARFLLAVPVGLLAVGVGQLLGFGQAILALFAPLFLAALLDGSAGLFSAVFQAREQMGWSSLILLGRNLARALGLGVALLIGGDLWSLALCWAVASSLNAGLSGWLLLRSEAIRFRLAAVGPVIRDALPFGSAIVGNLLLLQSDILMLGCFAGDGAVGQYHAAFRFIVLAELLPQVVSTVIIPRSYRIGHHEGSRNLSRFYRVQTLVLATLGVVGAVAVAVHGEQLARLALGDGYRESGLLLTALAPLVFLRFVLVPLGDALSSLGHQRRLSRAVWIGLAANVSLNLVLIPTLGALGAATATGLSQVVMLLALMAFARDTGLDSRWSGLLLQPLAAAGAAAAVVHLLPAAAPLAALLAAGLLLTLLIRFPSEEHRAALRVARLPLLRSATSA